MVSEYLGEFGDRLLAAQPDDDLARDDAERGVMVVVFRQGILAILTRHDIMVLTSAQEQVFAF
jgi:hypothetical protein